MSRTKHHINLKRRQRMQTPPPAFRRMLNSEEKAKVKHALQNGYYDNIPRFMKNALYDWL